MAETIKFSNWLQELAASSNHPFMRDSEKMIQYFFELENKLPSTYDWRYTSSETFKKQSEVVKKATSDRAFDELNILYWHDMVRNIEAYGLMTYWRAAEQFKSAVKLLDERDVLAPAVVSRSLLELGATVIVNSNNIRDTVKAALMNVAPIITSKELEELIVCLIWGTKVNGFSGYPRPIDSRKYREFISKNPNASEFPDVYKFLCGLTHPDMLGNARFWASDVTENEDGSITLRIERQAESALTTEIREKVLWALGWSAVCVRNGVEINQDAVATILKRWPK